MKLIIDKNEYWIKNDVELPSNFNQMNDNKKWNYIYKNNLLHKEDGPAIIYSNKYNSIFYYHSSETEVWYLNGKLHRLDGPAIICPDEYQAWYLNGLYHRIDGPAITYSDGTEFWYLNDNRVEEEIYKKIEGSTKEELLMYMVLTKYKDYTSLIEYNLNKK